MIRALFLLIRPLGWIASRPGARSTSVGATTPPVLLIVTTPLNPSALSLVKLFLRNREWHWLWAVSWGEERLQTVQRIEARRCIY